MRGINKVIVVGNIGRDPDTRYTPGGTAITEISVATSEQWKDKQTGEQQERTEWHRIKFFGRLAEIAGEYLKKGGQVYVEGKLRTDEYEKDGVKKWTTYIVAETLQMLGSKPAGSSGQRQGGAAQRQQGGAQPQGGGANFDDDEIPFD